MHVNLCAALLHGLSVGTEEVVDGHANVAHSAMYYLLCPHA
jgi:hypothetical protein